MGPHPFQTADAGDFHGRTQEVTELARLWRHNRLTVLDGAAGVGKTSLLRAGVLPALTGDRAAHVLPVARLALPSDLPLAALPELNPLALAVLTSWHPDESAARMFGAPIRSVMRRNARVDRFGAPMPTFAAIDKMDQLLYAEGWKRRRFVTELAEAMNKLPDLRLLIVTRTESLTGLRDLLARDNLPTDSAARFTLHDLDPAAARAAICETLADPAHPLCVNADRLVDDLGAGSGRIDPGLLQIAGQRLEDEFETLPGGIDRALTERCQSIIALVAADHGLPPGRLAERFQRQFGERAESRELPETVLGALEDAGLLRSEGPGAYRLRHRRLRRVVGLLSTARTAAAPAYRPRLDEAEDVLALGDLDRARRRATSVLRNAQEPRIRASAECLLGTIAYHQARSPEAIEHYDAAGLAFGALGDTAHVGMLLAAIGRMEIDTRPTQAVNRLRAALTQLPDDLFVKTALAQAFWYAGRTHAAIAVLDDALSRHGGFPEALRLRGELLADLNKADRALQDLDRVDREEWPSSRAAWDLARLTEGLGGSTSTRWQLTDDVADSGPVLLRVARVRQLEGDPDTAAGLAKRAISANHPPLPQHLRKEAERLITR